jgi:CheY-like chemotaxis protein
MLLCLGVLTQTLRMPRRRKRVSLLDGKRVLIVEDEPIVAMVAEDILLDLGAEIVGPAAHLDDALRLASVEEVHLAILDVNLNGRMSWPVAEKLRARSVPYVFATGYGDAGMVGLEFGAPVVQKPYSQEDLREALSRIAA